MSEVNFKCVKIRHCKMICVWIYHDITICRSKLLKQTMALDTEDDKGLFPDLKKELDFFDVRNTYNSDKFN